jgi:hypothetical protein
LAAAAYPMAEAGTTGRPRLVVVAGRGPASRPLTGNRPLAGSRQGAAVYRRRRAVALALLAMGVLLAWLSLRALLAGPAGGTLPAGGSAGSILPAGIGMLQPAAVHIHVVQPGETLWSIVAGTGRSGDPRPEVDRLARQLGGRPLQVGQRLAVP